MCSSEKIVDVRRLANTLRNSSASAMESDGGGASPSPSTLRLLEYEIVTPIWWASPAKLIKQALPLIIKFNPLIADLM